MLLVFILLGIVIFCCSTMLMLLLATIKFEVKTLHMTNHTKKIKNKIFLTISICFFHHKQIVLFTTHHTKIQKWMKNRGENIQKIKENKVIQKEVFDMLKNISFTIEKLEIDGYFSTFHPVLSSSIYAIFQAVIPIIIRKKMNGNYKNTVQFLNIQDNTMNLSFHCIISTKMVNIINIVFHIRKKGGKENGKSSNRRTYAYSHE